MRNFSIGSIFGIEIAFNWSWVIIFVIITFQLSVILFPGIHPEWSAALSWLIGVSASLLFFGSVLTHEIAHSLLAKFFGIEVKRIVLFIFGGVSDIKEEPKKPLAEFVIAAVGPLTSFLLGVIFINLARIDNNLNPGISNTNALISSLSPISTLFLWLGLINTILAAFNLIPGFPLDGGRVFRSIVWFISGDYIFSTKAAAILGVVVAWGFIITGVAIAFGVSVPYLGGGIGSGVWLILIGFFLNSLAIQSFLSVNRK